MDKFKKNLLDFCVEVAGFNFVGWAVWIAIDANAEQNMFRFCFAIACGISVFKSVWTIKR